MVKKANDANALRLQSVILINLVLAIVPLVANLVGVALRHQVTQVELVSADGPEGTRRHAPILVRAVLEVGVAEGDGKRGKCTALGAVRARHKR